MAHDINEEFLFARVMAVDSLLRGDTSRHADRIHACRLIPLLQKEPARGGANPFARLLGAAIASVFDGHAAFPYRTVRYVYTA